MRKAHSKCNKMMLEKHHVSYARNNRHQTGQGLPEKLLKFVHTDKCPIRVKSLCSSSCINEVLSARVDFIELFFKRKQEAHFDYCQRPLQADSTAHCKTVKEVNTHPYSFGMPKTSNFMAKTNTEL